MRTTYSLSIEMSLIQEFKDLCYSKKLKHHRVVEQLLYEWIQNTKQANVQLITCSICDAKYSERLANCPNCEQRRIEAQLEKRDVQVKEAKIQELQNEIIKFQNRAIEIKNDDEMSKKDKDRKIKGYAKDIENIKKKISKIM